MVTKDISKAVLLVATYKYLIHNRDRCLFGSIQECHMKACTMLAIKAATGLTATWDDFSKEGMQSALDAVLDMLLRMCDEDKYQSSPVYAVAFESLYVPEDWISITEDLVDCRIWTSEVLGVDSGWSIEEAATLSALEVGDYLLQYSDQGHSIFRVK